MQPLSDDPEENLSAFFADAIELGCIWGLEGPDGWALCPSDKYTSTDVIPFWSQPEYAKDHCRDEWADYQVVPVSLEEFLEEWLPGMHEDVFLVGVNWDDELSGAEIEPLDLLKEFEDLLAQP
ncbi:DUF2750 domain-containing protein [Aurantivibrio plasticivorans]